MHQHGHFKLCELMGVRLTSLVVAIVCVMGLTPRGQAQPIGWDIQNIDYPGSKTTVPTRINNAADIIGFTTLSDYFLLRNGVFAKIIFPSRPPQFKTNSTVLGGINNLGTIVGTDEVCDVVTNFPYEICKDNGFLLSGGTFTTLDLTFSSLVSTSGINDFGDIVGNFANSGNYPLYHGYILRGGIRTTVDSPYPDFGGNTFLTGINNSGDVVGYGAGGFLLKNGQFTRILAPYALGQPEAAKVSAINNLGDIVGIYNGNDGIPRGFILRVGVFTSIELSSNGTYVTGINDSGQIVGYFNDSTGTHGFLARPPLFQIQSGDHQTGNPAQQLAQPLVVKVVTPSGAPVAGAQISFQITTQPAGSPPPGFGEASLSTVLTITDSNGIASSQFTLGNQQGQYQVMASCATCAPSYVTFTEGLPTVTFGLVSGGLPFQMFDSHTLQVNVTGHFSQDSTTTKSLSVNATINGTQVVSVLPLPVGAVGDQPNSLFIDLAASGVPKFIDNQKFQITATIAETATTNTSQTAAEIPLPVVHVHGILTDCFPTYVPTDLWEFLISQHPAYVEDDGPTLTKPYPTLVSFNYSSLTLDAAASAFQLAGWITNTVLPLTYASRVNIVAHSLGGIISRTAITRYGIGSQVDKLILVGSPSEGLTFAPIALIDWNAIPVIISAVSSVFPAVDFIPSLSNALSCLVKGQKATTQELLPTYPWWSSTQGGSLSVPNSYVNPLLPLLNAQGLDSSVSYYAIVASGWPTETLSWGRTFFTGTNGSLVSSASYGPGDGMVPINSQKGSDLGWPMGTGPGKLNVYGDAGKMFHTDYFKNPSPAISWVSLILWQ